MLRPVLRRAAVPLAVVAALAGYLAWRWAAGSERRALERWIDELVAGVPSRAAAEYLEIADLEGGFRFEAAGEPNLYETADREAFLAEARGWVEAVRGSKVSTGSRKVELEGDRAWAKVIGRWQPPGGQWDPVMMVAELGLRRAGGAWRVREAAVWWGGEALRRSVGGAPRDYFKR
jgi:hypothetical protein